jgi:hypothetical protein
MSCPHEREHLRVACVTPARDLAHHGAYDAIPAHEIEAAQGIILRAGILAQVHRRVLETLSGVYLLRREVHGITVNLRWRRWT